MTFEPNNLLITGGAGFIGANFVRHWLARPGSGQVLVLDALTYAGNEASLKGLEQSGRFSFVRGDICDAALVDELLPRYQIDTIVHFAAESHVDRSILGPDDFIRTNVVGTHALLKAAKKYWLNARNPRKHRFHHVSTDEVYGSLTPNDPAFSELTPYAPNSPYSATKAASDHLVRAYRETYGLCTTLTNCSNNYGPFQFPEKLIPLIIINILSGKPLPVYGDGLQVRDWLHVVDHCKAIELALTQGPVGGVYNIGGNCETTNIQVIRTICALLDEAYQTRPELRADFPDAPASRGLRSETLISHIRDRPGHDRRYAVDFAKARRELGYSPSFDLATGLSETIEWYLSNRPWWRALLGSEYAEWLASNYACGSGHV